ncbi:class C sortase [Corynebacterium auriscanis]|uniref:class C sortase n=1 Tax=Corynebacterium auriscanis TaxID=99807 RepID=UPI003CEC2815
MSINTAKPQHQRNSHGKPPSVFRKTFLPLLVIIVGMLVMLYPVYASQWNNFQQHRISQRYQEDIQQADPHKLSEAVEKAREYNKQHTNGPILDPWLARVNEDNTEYRDYLAQLSGQSAMSIVSIPSIESQLPVYHGTTDEVLQKGLGHLYGSALPVGGKGFHSVITGHTGLSNATLFDNLIDVKKGDAIYVSTFGEKLKYQVFDTEVVLPDQIDGLKAKTGQDLLTLVTCTPYGVNTHRLLVHAKRVPLDPSDEEAFSNKGWKIQPWMWGLMALALAIITILVWWIRREKRKVESLESK